jgi:hypoxanthine phosphoribosyltransferase
MSDDSHLARRVAKPKSDFEGALDVTIFRDLIWGDFDRAVAWLAQHLKDIPAVGIYGEPRGGLSLAVTLSHRLALPYLVQMRPGAIWVDDIVDTGRTRDAVMDASICVAWFTRQKREDVLAAEVCTGGEWLVFPWCPLETAEAERSFYLARRSRSSLSGDAGDRDLS